MHAVRQETATSSGGLRRHLGAWDLTAIGIGATVGAGIFVLSGVVAHDVGPAVIITFLLAGLACAFSALAYAEMSAALPITGSAYSYTYATLGEGMAWLVGWNLLLEYVLGSSLVARGWSGYLAGMLGDLGVTLPNALQNGPFDSSTDPSQAAGIIDLPAVLIVLAMACIVVLGIRESARFTKAMVVLKLTAVLTVILVGSTCIDSANWTPFAPEGITPIFKGTVLVFLAFVGFDVVSSTAAEVRNPGRDLPLGILRTLVICTILYCLMAATLTGIVHYKDIDPDSPITSAFRSAQLPFIGGVIAAGALIGMASVLLALLVGLPRILMAMGRDGLVPAWTATVNQRTGSPVAVTIVATVVIASAAGLLPLADLANMTGIGTLTAFAAVSASVTLLRKREPNLPRPFRIPGPDWLPLGGTIICVGLMVVLLFTAKQTLLISLFVWLALGSTLYALYGFRKSALRRSNASDAINSGNPTTL